MGDRGNIVVVQHGQPPKNAEQPPELIYLYAHWGGSELPRSLQAALTKRWRWNDESYLTRIIFDELSAGSHDTETSFGISTYIGDNEYPLLVVDAAEQLVWMAEAATPLTAVASWTFDTFCALDLTEEDAWAVLRGGRVDGA